MLWRTLTNASRDLQNLKATNSFLTLSEPQISSHPNFPRFWRRYVDGIFAIVKRHRVDATLKWLNGVDEHLKFTKEVEVDGNLPFLELLIYRSGNDIEFKIYRKPTATDRYITSDSFHAPNHQHAAFISMAFRIFNDLEWYELQRRIVLYGEIGTNKWF